MEYKYVIREYGKVILVADTEEDAVALSEAIYECGDAETKVRKVPYIPKSEHPAEEQ